MSLCKALDHYERVKIVSVIRNPVKRAFSAYWHMRGKNDATETRSLDAILTALPCGVPGDVLFDAENDLLANAVEAREINGRYLSQDYLKQEMGPSAPDFDAPDPLWCHRYIGESCFSHLLDKFGDDTERVQHRSFVLEELMRSRENQKALLEFVGFTGDLKVALDDMQISNPGLVRGRLGRLTEVKRTRLGKVLLDRSPKKLKTKFKSLLFRRSPSITADQYNQIREIFASEFDYWKARGVATEDLWTL